MKKRMDTELYGLSKRAANQIKKQYTINCYDTNKIEFRFLRGMFLSRNSIAARTKSNKAGLLCCGECSASIRNMKRKDTNTCTLPKHAIANGLYIGRPPRILQDLNEVEISLISIARTDKHVFSFTAGTHKSIRGWHSMYYNDLGKANRYINWCANRHSDDGDEDDETGVDSDNSEIVQDSSNSDEESNDDDSGPRQLRRKGPKIVVVLGGPFTTSQLALAKKRTWRRRKKRRRRKMKRKRS